uniref:Uncharacterized protein n=1 Tax=Arundo donax TaxID=35708 RepID=A0A0A9ARF7_ARUDO
MPVCHSDYLFACNVPALICSIFRWITSSVSCLVFFLLDFKSEAF